MSISDNDLKALSEQYPLSPDVVRKNKVNPDLEYVNRGYYPDKANPAAALINNPEKLERLRKSLGLPAETEKDFASWFAGFLAIHGYKWFHIFPARVMRNGKEIYETPTSGESGIEDYFIWHEDKRFYAWVELKSEKGTLSEKQKATIESHKKAGLCVFVFKPSQRAEIERLL